MNHSVTKLNLDFTNCYLIRGNSGYLLIDAGRKNRGGDFNRKLFRASIDPPDISLIIITHAHFDHVGSLAEIKKLTGAETAASSLEAELIQHGKVVLPAGTNPVTGLLASAGSRYFTGMFAFEKSEVDIIINEDISLSQWGIDGRIVQTPGHTAGSISVILNDGRAFVGDCMANFPFAGNIFPPFADDVGALLGSWKKLIDSGADEFFPGHGGVITRKRLEAALESKSTSG